MQDAERADWREMRRRARWERRKNRPFGPGKAISALLIIAVGVAFLLDNLDVIYIRDVWEFWPVILIALGVSRLAYGRRGIFPGLLLTTIGGVFLLSNLGYLPSNVWRDMWPLLLIVVGVGMLFGPARHWDWQQRQHSFSGTTLTSHEKTFDESAIFNHVSKRIESQEFEGGEANAIFGGVEIDLRGAATQKDEMRLEANAIFGGVDIIVPDAWDISVQGEGVFGGYDDRTLNHPASTVAGQPVRPRLVVKGSAFFGGVVVRS